MTATSPLVYSNLKYIDRCQSRGDFYWELLANKSKSTIKRLRGFKQECKFDWFVAGAVAHTFLFTSLRLEGKKSLDGFILKSKVFSTLKSGWFFANWTFYKRENFKHSKYFEHGTTRCLWTVIFLNFEHTGEIYLHNKKIISNWFGNASWHKAKLCFWGKIARLS